HQIPVESETRMRKFLQEAMPQIADRDFSFARICWDADTVDRQFLIDRPKGKSGLVVAAGGSGMGFMMMPVVGQLIVDRMEGVMEERLQKGLRWRPEQAINRDWQAIQDRHGGEGKIMDFHDVKEWTSGKGDRVPNTELAKDSKTCSTM
ncbi:fructosyl amine:oxygen oxidoreductase, partial [Aureobasidium melanogenum]